MSAVCRRCGVRREVNECRPVNDLCLDCKAVVVRVVDLCGTMQGHWLHLTAGEPPCVRCLEARRRQDAANRRRKGIRERRPAKCGTDSGYHRHRRLRQAVCADCLRAHSVANPSRRKEAA